MANGNFIPPEARKEGSGFVPPEVKKNESQEEVFSPLELVSQTTSDVSSEPFPTLSVDTDWGIYPVDATGEIPEEFKVASDEPRQRIAAQLADQRSRSSLLNSKNIAQEKAKELLPEVDSIGSNLLAMQDNFNNEATVLKEKYSQYLDTETNKFVLPPDLQEEFSADAEKLSSLKKNYDAGLADYNSKFGQYKKEARRSALMSKALAEEGSVMGSLFTGLTSEGIPSIVAGFGKFIKDQALIQAQAMLGQGQEYETYVDPETGQVGTRIDTSLPERQSEIMKGLDEQLNLSKNIQDFEDAASDILYQTVSLPLGGATKEYMEDKSDKFWVQAMRGLGTSIPAMLAAVPTMGTSFLAQSYDMADDTLRDIEGLSEDEKVLYKTAYAGTIGLLERYGFRNLVNNQSIVSNIFGRALNKIGQSNLQKAGVAKAFERAILNEATNVQNALRLGQKTATGALAEFETGFLQSGAENALQQGINAAKGKEIFEDKDWGEVLNNMFEEGLMEAVGGGFVTGFITPFTRQRATTAEYQEAVNFIQDVDLDVIGQNLEVSVREGNLSKEQADKAYNEIKEYKEFLATVPRDLSEKAKVSAVALLKRRKSLESTITELEKKRDAIDDSFTTEKQKYQDRIDTIQEEVDANNKALSVLSTQEEVAKEEVAEEAPEEVAEEVVEEQVADTDSENILDAREKFNTVSERASRNEPINENEIDEAINEAYDALSELEGKDSQEAQIMQELIEDEIQKLEQYDNKTTTETRKIAEERTVRTVKKTPRKTVPSREKDFVGKKAVVADNKGGGVRGLVEIVETPDGREYYIVRSEGDTKTEVVGAKTDGKKTTRRVAKVNGFGEAFVLGETSKVFSEATVNFDKDGNPVSVTFPVGKDGKQVTVKSPEIAAEFELEQMKQQEYDEQVFEETFIEFTGEEQVEVRKPTPPRQTQEKTDAVQERSTEEVDVRQQAEDGKEVGERDTKEQEPTKESKKKDKVISAKDEKGFSGLLQKVFGLKKKQANAASKVADAIINTIAQRTGTTKEEVYRRIGLVKADKKLMEQIQKNPAILFQVIAFHGSPYQFDKFLTEAIGTGEGVQAFGWGLYFSDLEGIGRGYAEYLSNRVYLVDGIEVVPDENDDTQFFQTVGQVARNGFNVTKERALSGEYYSEKAGERILKNLEKLEGKDVKIKPTRNLYKVSLHKGKTPDQYTWLEWDKTLSKKIINSVIDKIISEGHIQKLKDNYLPLRRAIPFMGNKGKSEAEITRETLERYFYDNKNGGKYLQEFLNKNIFGNYKDVSAFLLRAGVDGVKYPAESVSRGATSDTARGFNYVVFDENAVSIEEVIKFQKDAVAARGAMMIGMDAQAIIYALTDPNVSTPLHELAHVYEKYMTEEEVAAVEAASGFKSGTTQFSEYFARGFEKYLSEGKSPNSKLKKAFENFKEWLTEIYNGIVDSDIDVELNDEMRAIYDTMLTGMSSEKVTAAEKKRQSISTLVADNQDKLTGENEVFADFNPNEYPSLSSRANNGIELLNIIEEGLTNIAEGKTFGVKKAREVVKSLKEQKELIDKGVKAKQSPKAIFNVESAVSKIPFIGKTLSNFVKGFKVNLSKNQHNTTTFLTYIFAGDKNVDRVSIASGVFDLDRAQTKQRALSQNYNLLMNEAIANLGDKPDSEIAAAQIAGYIEQYIRQSGATETEDVVNAINLAIADFRHSIEVNNKIGRNSNQVIAISKNIDRFVGKTSLDEVMNVLSENEYNFLKAVKEANNYELDGKVREADNAGIQFTPLDDYIHLHYRIEGSPSLESVGDIQDFMNESEIRQKKSGAIEQRVKQKRPLSGNDYIDFDFIGQQKASFDKTNEAIYSHIPIVKLSAFRDNPTTEELMGGGERGFKNKNLFVQNIVPTQLFMSAIQRNIPANISGIRRMAMNVMRKMQMFSVRLVMRSAPNQMIAQSMVYTNTLGHMTFANPVSALNIVGRTPHLISHYRDHVKRVEASEGIVYSDYAWLELMKNAPESVRDIVENIIKEGSTQLIGDSPISFKRVRNAKRTYDRYQDKADEIAFKSMDRAAAQISFLNLYESYMINNGLTEAIPNDYEGYMAWWSAQGKNPNEEAISYASRLVDKDQNASMPSKKSRIQMDKSFSEFILKRMFLPFLGFKIKKVSSFGDDIRIVASTSRDVNSKDRFYALGRALGTFTETTAYNAYKIYVANAIYTSIGNLIIRAFDIEAEDEDVIEKANKQSKKMVSRILADVSGVNIHPSVHKGFALGWNYLYYDYMTRVSDKFEDMYPSFEDFNRSGDPPAEVPFTDDGIIGETGFLGIPIEAVAVEAELIAAGLNGENYDYSEMINTLGARGDQKRYYTEKEQEAMLIMATVYGAVLLAPTSANSTYRFSVQSAERNIDAVDTETKRALKQALQEGEISKKDFEDAVVNDLNTYVKELQDYAGYLGVEGVGRAIESDIKDFSKSALDNYVYNLLGYDRKQAFYHNIHTRKYTPKQIANRAFNRYEGAKTQEEKDRIMRDFVVTTAHYNTSNTPKARNILAEFYRYVEQYKKK